MGTDPYSKLLPRKLGPYHIPSSTIEIVKIDQQGIPNTISSNRASLTLQTEKDSSATGAGALHQSQYPEGLPED